MGDTGEPLTGRAVGDPALLTWVTADVLARARGTATPSALKAPPAPPAAPGPSGGGPVVPVMLLPGVAFPEVAAAGAVRHATGHPHRRLDPRVAAWLALGLLVTVTAVLAAG